MAPLSTILSSAALSLSKRTPPSNLNLPLNLHPRIPTPTPASASPPSKPHQPQSPSYHPGSGTVDPTHVNNHAFFALFALLGLFLVLVSIWFFFRARNGGFHWRKGDWDDYKSTVLRRKGPNGTTLSGATKTTALGGGSVVAAGGPHDGEDEKAWSRGEQHRPNKEGRKWGKKSKPRRGNKNSEDVDVRAYRHEKPARVGGLNREADGVFNQDWAYSDTHTNADTHTYTDETASQPTTAPSMISGHVPINTPKKAKKEDGRDSRWAKTTAKRVVEQPVTPSPKKTGRGHDFYAQTPGSNTSTDSHRPLRPNAASPAGYNSPSRSRQSSPTKNRSSAHRSSGVPGSFRDSYTEALDMESRYSASDAGMTEDSRGTKAYFHPIPGLGSEARGGGGGGGGFRRGGMGRRRDSLSDSEGETGTMMS